ncbi:DedA family protein [Micromonospora sp. WMMD882]|uniref:DedA family protein n=1 Tax=Micromonospora sp. WMMD882 TaxID=3015151 RepID=UPI00248B30A3|nr:DedA family protein [Micromonospora sp. WMMD882]WBB82250.1 DedA family protein [Micromonospora sp. WMMD882]
MHDLVSLLEHLPAQWVYLVAALVVAGETALLVGLVAPGEATLLLVGFLAYAGTLRLGPAVLAMVVAAVAGDALAFRSGRRYGPRLRASRWGARVGSGRWGRADAMLGRLGGRGVFAARWVAFARTLVPRLAGAAGMPYRRFLPWNVAGVVTWVGGSVLVGFLAGGSYRTVSAYLGRATGAVLVLAGCVLAIVLAGRWLGRNPDPVRALFDRAVAVPPLSWVTRRYGVLLFLLGARIGATWTLLLNLTVGLALLFGAGFGMAGLLGLVVRHSGLAAVDTAIAGWFAARRTAGVVEVGLAVVSALRGAVLIAVIVVVAAALGWRRRVCRADLLGLLGTVGAFVPTVVVAVVADLTRPAGTSLFPTQNAVVSAGFCTLAWLLARGSRWPVAVAVWTAAAVGIAGVGLARLYLGLSSASGTVGSVLLGVLWTVVFVVAWATRARAVRAAAPPGGDSAPAGGDSAPAGGDAVTPAGSSGAGTR